MEPNADITSQNVGSHLVVDGKYQFSDLDELIVNHVKAMARKVEELMAFEKFSKGSDTEIRKYSLIFCVPVLSSLFFLVDQELDQKIRSMRNARSVYAFGLNRSRPGWFTLFFKANTMSPIQALVGIVRSYLRT